MKLLSYVQTLNNTLGIVETGRSLVTRQGSGHSSVSALSQQIETVGAALTSEVRGARDVLQQDIRTVSHMVSEVSTQQEVLRREIHQVIEGVAGLNVLMKKHMKSVEEQLRFLVEEPMQNACYQLTAHLTNKAGVGATDEEIRAWLRTLESWISKAATQKTVTMTSEEASQTLSQSPDNIGFIASRLRFLFGDIIPETFLALPSVSIKFYFTSIKLYLNGLEKHPHLLGGDKAASICHEIQNTLNVYLEFSKFLNNNPQIIQALFDQYDYNRDKIGRVMRTTNRTNIPVLAKSPELFAMEEIRLLLKHVVELMVDRVNINRVAKLDDLNQILGFGALDSAERKASITSTLTPIEQYRRQLQLGLANLNNDAWTRHLSKPATPGCFRTAAQMLFLNLIQEASTSDPVFSLQYEYNSNYEPAHYGAQEVPPPTHYILETVESYSPSWTTIYKSEDNYPSHYERSTTSESWKIMVHRPPVYYPATRSAQIPLTISKGTKPLSTYTLSMLWLYFGSDRARIDFLKASTPAQRSYRAFANNTPSEDYHGWHDSDGHCHGKKITAMTVDGRDSSSFFSQAKHEKLPAEYEAFIKNSSPADLEKYRILFKYYVLYSQGKLKEAESFIRQQSFSQDYEKSYLLYFVAVLGRWDVLEKFNKIHPLTSFNWTIRDTSLTPLMIAAQHGNSDVVMGLLLNIKSGDFLPAVQLAREQGFEDVAVMIERAQSGILPSIITPPAVASDYEKGLVEMRSSVTASKTKLGQYVPPSPVQQIALAAAAQTSLSLPDEVTDDEMEASLEKKTNTFSSERKRRIPSWKKSTDRRYQRTGFRVTGRNEFKDDDQFNEFFGYLQINFFKVSKLKTEGQLLVELPPMKP